MDHGDFITWEALEYIPRKRNTEWYVAVSIVTLAIAVTAILFNNVLFAVLIVVGVFALMLYTARAPKRVEFEISARGIRVDDVLYPYSTLDSFWISDATGIPKLLLKSQKFFMPLMTFPLPEDIDSDDIADVLISFLPEVEHQESLSEHLADRLGF